MDTLMFVITAVSVVVAMAASAIAWRATRAEQRRSALRVAALAAAAGVESTPAGTPTADAAAASPSGLHDFLPATEPGGMFTAPVADSGSGGRQHGLLAAAAVVAVLVGGGGLVMLVSGRAPAASGAATRVPLELVALGHARTDGQLVVTGLVQNPATGREVEQLEAHVRVFDTAGIMIATRSAPVNSPSLAPGHDTPFLVTLGEAATAARYRVSFASRGTMLAHVDRRTNLPAAVTAEAR